MKMTAGINDDTETQKNMQRWSLHDLSWPG